MGIESTKLVVLGIFRDIMMAKHITTNLVGGLEHFLLFRILGIIISTDFHIFQRGMYTTNHKLNVIPFHTGRFFWGFQLMDDENPKENPVAAL